MSDAEMAMARALRHLRGSPATDAAGHDDAEDADVLVSALRAAGYVLVDAGALRMLAVACETNAEYIGRTHGALGAIAGQLRAAQAQQEPADA
jgi:hypothetical protein